MGKNFLTKEESVIITGKFINKIFPNLQKLVDHEARHGFWLPSEFQSNPVAWLEALRIVESGMQEYINTKTKENE